MRVIAIIAVGVCVLGAGCGQSPPEGAVAQAPQAAAPTAPAPASSRPAPWTPSTDLSSARFSGLVGSKPATWQEQRPGGAMRAAEYIVPGRDGHNQAHIVVFSFPPGQGGTVDQNIQRWQGQFKPDEEGNPVVPVVGRLEGALLPITLVELAGDWMQMGAQWHTPDQLFLAAIVEAPRGMVVVRFAGETATVEANRGDFLKFAASLKPE